jgi:hypothetical protein
MAERGVYSDQDIVGALKAVDANLGYVKPTAAALGIPEKTLWNWTHRGGKRALAARRRMLSGNEDSAIADRYLDIVIAAQDQTMAALPKASAYQAVMIGAVAFDKRQLGLGRPTSRSEVVRTRYVEGDALHSMAARVIDVPALPSPVLPGQARTPKVAGVGRKSYPLRQSAGSKAKKKRAPRKAVAAPSLHSGGLVEQVREVGSVTPPSE